MEFKIVVTMVDVDLCLKIPDTLPHTRLDEFLMLVVEVDMGLNSTTLPPLTQVDVADFQVYKFHFILLKNSS